jgi:hypothetical protein
VKGVFFGIVKSGPALTVGGLLPVLLVAPQLAPVALAR